MIKMKERIRVRCPLCGMLPGIERLRVRSPYKFEIYLQRFGGRIRQEESTLPIEPRRGPKPRRGVGFMEYKKIQNPQMLREIKALLLERARQAEERLRAS
jgi:hypothetical protein